MNESQKQHLIEALEKGKRYDGRKKDEFRDIEIEKNVISSAQGSAKLTCGDVELISGVKIGTKEPYPDSLDEGVLIVNAELLPLSNPEFEPGRPGIDAIETSRVIDRTIRESETIDTKDLCIEEGEKVWLLNIDVCPLNADGNLIDLGALASMVALQETTFPALDKQDRIDYDKEGDTELDLAELPVAVTVVKIGDHLVVDPTETEEKAAGARLTVGTLGDGSVCSMQKGGEVPLSKEEVTEIVSLSKEKGKELRKKFLKS